MSGEFHFLPFSAYGYDTKGRLDALSHTLGANPSFASFGYTYNPVGNILDILDQVTPSENRSHAYDALQRLTSGGSVANAESYDYDLVGNRTTSFLSSTHNHDDLNRLLEDDQFTYTYDNNGNLQTKTNKAIPTDVTTYTWDAQDQLIQIDRSDSTTVTYAYDGLGRRIEKNVAGTITRYVYDGEDILLEYDGSNTFTARYSHGDQVDQPLVLQKAGQGFFYYHSNHQGSVTHLTDSSGTIANSYVYDSYGRQLTVSESVLQPYSYTGREFDVESGLYFYRARYFDATTGRFLSEDPIRFRAGDQNFYRYVRNNPLNFRDPFGLTEATNPGQGAAGIVDMANDVLDFIIDTNATNNFFEAVAEFESTLEPGQEVAVEILVNPNTGEVNIVPQTEASIRSEGTISIPGNLKGKGPDPNFPTLPPPGFDPNNSPLCNTCPCKK